MKLLIHDYAGHAFQVQLSRELARRGHEVVHAFAGGLLTPRGDLARRSDDPPTLRFVEVPMSPEYRESKYRFLRRRGFEVAYGGELQRLVASLRPEVVISGNTPTEPQWLLVQHARTLRVPVISWVQDFYSLAVARLARRKLPVFGMVAGWWYRWLDARCFRASAGVVAITDDFVPRLRSMGVRPDNITVVPNWAPLDELPVRPRTNLWSVARGLHDQFVFMYTGTLGMKHNPELLVALAERFRAVPGVRIVVVSEGPGAEHLCRCRAERRLGNLDLFPFQNFADMPDVLASADVLVAVLEADAGVFSVPSKVLSYHCAARPILGAMPSENLAARIVRENATGITAAPHESAVFVNAALRLHRDAALREAMGRAARRYAEVNFRLSEIVGRFEALARRALPARRPGPVVSLARPRLST